MAKIEDMHPRTGRALKEDNTVVNTAEMLEAIYNALVINKDAGITLTGSILTQDPETGVKTVTSTAAELFSGTSALAGRDKLIIYNEGANNVYWGKGIVTPQTGFPLLPGDSIVFSLDPNQDIPVYFVAETDVVVRVGELA